MKRIPVIRIEKKVGTGIIKVAARHNLRDFDAGAITPENIDATRSQHNVVLRGPGSADEVAGTAKALLALAGVAKLRKDAVRGVEVLVSLPAGVEVDLISFFEAATAWAETYFPVPLLSSVVHLDEAAPHCHILLLPLVDGRMQGSDMVGGPVKLQATKDNFYHAVAKPFGMDIPPILPRIAGKEKRWVLDEAARRLKAMGVNDDVLLEVLLESHANNPAALANALGIAAKRPKKSFASIMTKPCPEPHKSRMAKNPIGFVTPINPELQQTLSCVGFTSSDDNFDSTKPVPRHKDDLAQPVQIQVEVAAHDAIEGNTDERTVIRESDMPAGWWDEVTGTFQLPAVQPRKKAAVQAAVDVALNRINHRNSEAAEHHDLPSILSPAAKRP